MNVPVKARPSVDVGQLLDQGAFTTFQKAVVLLAALSIVMDGFDGQMIGFAIPSIMKDWGVTRGDFAPVVAAGLIGMGVGSASVGLLADRFGRRWALIGSVVLFAVATSSIGLAPNLAGIALLRFIAGLGVGGALPIATTMAAEFTPVRQRTLAVTVTIVCVPLGGMLGGFYANAVLPAYDWRPLFLMAGLAPLALGAALVVGMPESPRFLVRRNARWPELEKLLARMSRSVPAAAEFVDVVEQAVVKSRNSVAALFDDGYARDTLALWCAFFMCLLAVYTAFSWLPTMLVVEGLSVALASAGLTAYNLGGVLGAVGCAIAINHFGSRWPLMLSCLAAAACAFALRYVNIHDNVRALIFGLGLHGLFVNAVQSTMFALCAYIYTTDVRATGAASALAFGRLGAILSAFAGAIVITAGGASAYLTMLGAAMLVVCVALGVVKRHIPRLARV
jgi:MFS transporter, AAHS family, 4-hydroxybenzoate transporter